MASPSTQARIFSLGNRFTRRRRCVQNARHLTETGFWKVQGSDKRVDNGGVEWAPGRKVWTFSAFHAEHSRHDHKAASAVAGYSNRSHEEVSARRTLALVGSDDQRVIGPGG